MACRPECQTPELRLSLDMPALLRSGWLCLGDSSHLLQDRQVVVLDPHLLYLSVSDMEEIEPLDVDPLPARWHAEVITPMGAVGGPADDHGVARHDRLKMLDLEVGEGGFQPSCQLFGRIPPLKHLLICVDRDVRREGLFREPELPLLHHLQVPAMRHGLGLVVCHGLLSFPELQTQDASVSSSCQERNNQATSRPR